MHNILNSDVHFALQGHNIKHATDQHTICTTRLFYMAARLVYNDLFIYLRTAENGRDLKETLDLYINYIDFIG